jgi:hypothetical protein
VSTKIRAWAYLPDPQPGEAPFSVRRFVEQEEGDAWLFLTSRKDQHAFLRPLLSLWCDQAAASILSLPPDLSRRFWVVFFKFGLMLSIRTYGNSRKHLEFLRTKQKRRTCEAIPSNKH